MVGVQRIDEAVSRRSLLASGLVGGLLVAFHVPVRALLASQYSRRMMLPTNLRRTPLFASSIRGRLRWLCLRSKWGRVFIRRSR